MEPDESANATLTIIVPEDAKAYENVEIKVLTQSSGNSKREGFNSCLPFDGCCDCFDSFDVFDDGERQKEKREN